MKWVVLITREIEIEAPDAKAAAVSAFATTILPSGLANVQFSVSPLVSTKGVPDEQQVSLTWKDLLPNGN